MYTKSKSLNFELLCYGFKGKVNELSFAHEIAYSEYLWKGFLPQVAVKEDRIDIFNNNLGLTVSVQSIDPTSILSTFLENAYLITMTGVNYQAIEPYRVKLLRVLNKDYKIKHIRLINDDVSAHIARELFPEINIVENMVRSYIMRDLLQIVDLDWVEEIIKTKPNPSQVPGKMETRSIPSLLSSKINYIDFNSLGPIITHNITKFEVPKRVIKKFFKEKTIQDARATIEKLNENYSAYFLKNFYDTQFQRQWETIAKIRNKVINQGILNDDDLVYGHKILHSLDEIIVNAKKYFDNILLTDDDKERILSEKNETLASIEAKIALMVLEREGLGEYLDVTDDDEYKIEEEVLIFELASLKLINKENHKFIGLKWFVTEYLAKRNYNVDYTYYIINKLKEEGKIILFEVQRGEKNIAGVKLPEKED